MKKNTKSSVTLPVEELRLVEDLKKKLGAKTKVEVIRRGLRLLKERSERELLKEAYREAARKVRESTLAELEDLDHLAAEGIGNT